MEKQLLTTDLYIDNENKIHFIEIDGIKIKVDPVITILDYIKDELNNSYEDEKGAFNL